MVPITPDNSILWIVNYRRWDECASTVEQWFESFPFKKCIIIANHSGQSLDRFSSKVRPYITIWDNVFRPDFMMGSLAQCWNTCYLNTFLEYDWAVCSQDDMDIRVGWDSLINNNLTYNTFFAPIGDMVHFQSRRGFSEVGWWDERFRLVGYSEHDYMLRNIQDQPKNVSICDNHKWELHYNDIGLSDYLTESPRTSEIMVTRKECNTLQETREGTFNMLWGADRDHVFETRQFDIKKKVPDIDWYPSFTRRFSDEYKVSFI